MSTQNASTYIGSVGKEKISQKEFLITARYFELLNQSGANRKQKNEEIETQKDEKQEIKKEEDSFQQSQKEGPQTENKFPLEEPLSYDQIKGLAWQMIVLSREAKREGIAVTDEEVQTEIRKLFSKNGVFHQDFYEQWVQNNFRVQAREFEELIRKHIASDKLREKVLKDVPEEQHQNQWLEWFIPVMSKSEFKDLEKPAAEASVPTT